ncbi:MAG: ATP-grasp domain-containing protein [Candidatus Omnitrophica bacterium]|nr:ATP-grasp domain-containing protein [Candidatus Omnitrophota bacterium]
MKASILITGTGGGVGQSILKSLQDTDYRLIAADAEALATGLYTADQSYRIPFASDPAYLQALLKICAQEKCSFIFPGLDPELLLIAEGMQQFLNIKTVPVVSSPEVIRIADDKLRTYEFLTSHAISAPITLPLSAEAAKQIPFPMVLKPRKGGSRSSGVFVVHNESELSFRLSTLPLNNYIAQEYLDGDEYTCGTITFNGRCYGSIVMKRILRDGDTYKAFVVKDSRISRHVENVAEILKPFGPCNFQLRMKDHQPCIFEINARCSGTTYCRTLAGFNEPGMMIDLIAQGKIPDYTIRDITILRYWKELVIDSSRLDELQEHGHSKGSRVPL